MTITKPNIAMKDIKREKLSLKIYLTGQRVLFNKINVWESLQGTCN